MARSVLIGVLILGSAIVVGLLIATIVGISIITEWLNWWGKDKEGEDD